MSLESGHYIITSLSGNCAVGRYYVEDLSLLPKRICMLNKGLGPSSRPWIIEKTNKGTYKMSANGARVGDFKGLLSAYLLADMMQGPMEWNITPVPQMGKSCYIIEEADGDQRGWVAANEDGEQLALRPLIATPSEPPRYPQTEVFIIEAAKE